MSIVGTAGHVDHGKSTLVEKLTGINPDRLLEEKKRGLTIDIGFSWMKDQDNNEISFIDVPGHEKFISNMLTGISGIDLVLMVIAADESIMPQTIEHLQIINLLSINNGIIAITKTDLIEKEFLSLIKDEISDLILGTSIENAPIIETSSNTGIGIQELKKEIFSKIKTIPSKTNIMKPRFPVDRSFSLPGFGTIATGTLLDGTLSVGQEIIVLPEKYKGKIRSIQTHQNSIDSAKPGNRIGINLSGISHQQIKRGQTIVLPNQQQTSSAADVKLISLNENIKHNCVVNLHFATNQTLCKVRLLDRNVLTNQSSCFAQIKLNDPFSFQKNDAFIIRLGNKTIGGGIIIDPQPPRHKRNSKQILERLKNLSSDSNEKVILEIIGKSICINTKSISKICNISLEKTSESLEKLLKSNKISQLKNNQLDKKNYFIQVEKEKILKKKIKQSLNHYHLEFPMKKGASKSYISSKIKISPEIFELLLNSLIESEELIQTHSTIQLKSHSPKLSDKQKIEAKKYIKALKSNYYSPPTDFQIEKDILNFLIDQNKVVQISENIIYSIDIYKEMLSKINKTLITKNIFKVDDFKSLFKTTRKYTIPFLEHLDESLITKRFEDGRIKYDSQMQ